MIILSGVKILCQNVQDKRRLFTLTYIKMVNVITIIQRPVYVNVPADLQMKAYVHYE